MTIVGEWNGLGFLIVEPSAPTRGDEIQFENPDEES